MAERSEKSSPDLRTLISARLWLVGGIVFIAILCSAYFLVTNEMERDTAALMRSECTYLDLQIERVLEIRSLYDATIDKLGENAVALSASEIERLDRVTSPGLALNFYPESEHGLVAIFDSDGNLISSNSPRFITCKTIEDCYPQATVEAIDRAKKTKMPQTVLYSAGIAPVNANPDAEGAHSQGTQKGLLITVDAAEETMVVAIRPNSMVYEGLWRALLSLAIGVAIFLLVVFGIVFLSLSGSVVKRIHEIKEVLARISSGDLEARAEASGTKEFEELSEDINITVDTLKGLINEAEQRNAAELATARTIQVSSLPTDFATFSRTSGVSIFATTEPAREVGGDFYDFYALDDGQGVKKLVFMIADVSGKGIPGALFMMRAKAQLRDTISSGLNLADAITTANTKLCDGNDAGMFVTAWIAVLTPETGHFEYVNAGHNPPLLRRDGQWTWMREKSGLPLGMFDGPVYKQFSASCDPGDEFLLYTDGVTEAMDVYERLYGESRLMNVVENNKDAHPQELVEALYADTKRHAEGAEQSDDITIISLQLPEC